MPEQETKLAPTLKWCFHPGKKLQENPLIQNIHTSHFQHMQLSSSFLHTLFLHSPQSSFPSTLSCIFPTSHLPIRKVCICPFLFYFSTPCFVCLFVLLFNSMFYLELHSTHKDRKDQAVETVSPASVRAGLHLFMRLLGKWDSAARSSKTNTL